MTKYSEQITTKLKLPYAKSIATIAHYNAKDVILSLLTDPRIRDEDDLFFGNDDPLGSPPDSLSRDMPVSHEAHTVNNTVAALQRPHQNPPWSPPISIQSHIIHANVHTLLKSTIRGHSLITPPFTGTSATRFSTTLLPHWDLKPTTTKTKHWY